MTASTHDEHFGKVVTVSVAAAIGGFLFGFDSSVVNGAVDSLQDKYDLNSFMKGFVVAIALLGCALGAWFAGRLADRWGRKKVMVLGAVMFIVSSIGQSLAVNVPDLLCWRVLGGIGIGIASVIAPAYISEIAPARYRGALGSLQQLAITSGICIALVSDALLRGWAGGASDVLWWHMASWRWMFLVGVIPAAVYGFVALMIPESPRYLVGQGLDDEAAKILREVTGEADPLSRVTEIKLTLKRESAVSIRDILGPTFGLHPLVWVGIWLAIFQQFVGINVIFYYSTTLWHSVGFSEGSSFRISVITGIVNVVMTFVAIGFVDRVGRRMLLSIGSLGMFVGLLLACIAFTQQQGHGDDITLPNAWGKLALVGANMFVVFFAATWGPVMWVMLGEMFPNRIKGIALGVCSAVNWIANFTISLLFPQMNKSVGLTYIYGFFALCALISYFYVKFKVPETKGMELEEMDTLKVAAER